MLKVPLRQRGSFPLRSVEMMKQHNQSFLQDGGGDIYNYIAEPLVNIPLDKVWQHKTLLAFLHIDRSASLGFILARVYLTDYTNY